jgi:16S rRNA (guanine527-N7)-methyltransferase
LRNMSAEVTLPRVAQLAERYGLSARQREQLAGLLSMLGREPRAPTSVRRPEQAVDVHIADSLVALELEAVRTAGAIADVGSGAGFPGLPLAVALEGSEVRLVESQVRKCFYLERTIAEVGLGNARVVCGRAEDWSEGRGENDAVIARAVAAPPVVVEYAAPLLRRGGMLIDWRGRRARIEERRAAEAAEQLGMRPKEIRKVMPFAGAHDRHLHLYMKVSETPSGFPRRAGMASRRPLGADPPGSPAAREGG